MAKPEPAPLPCMLVYPVPLGHASELPQHGRVTGNGVRWAWGIIGRSGLALCRGVGTWPTPTQAREAGQVVAGYLVGALPVVVGVEYPA